VCLLVIIGVRSDGRKELVALTDGFRESAESWTDLLRDAKRHGMAAPVLAVGDGALGRWKAGA
jgi:putative transposase